LALEVSERSMGVASLPYPSSMTIAWFALVVPLIVVAGWAGRRMWSGKAGILEEADRQWAEREHTTDD
jgi:hypothetical protein